MFLFSGTCYLEIPIAQVVQDEYIHINYVCFVAYLCAVVTQSAPPARFDGGSTMLRHR